MSAWQDKATCRRFPELFFDRSEQRFAVHVCLYHCPVLRDCNAWAKERFTDSQVLGGQAYGSSGEVLEKLPGYSDVRAHNVYCRALEHTEKGSA